MISFYPLSPEALTISYPHCGESRFELRLIQPYFPSEE